MATLKRGIASNIRPSGHLMVPDPCLMLQDRNCARQHCWLGSAFGRDLSLVHLVLYPIAVELPAIGPHISACRYRLICRWIGSSFCSKTGRQGIRPLPSPCMSLLMKFPWAGLRTMNSNSKSDKQFRFSSFLQVWSLVHAALTPHEFAMTMFPGKRIGFRHFSLNFDGDDKRHGFFSFAVLPSLKEPVKIDPSPHRSMPWPSLQGVIRKNVSEYCQSHNWNAEIQDDNISQNIITDHHSIKV